MLPIVTMVTTLINIAAVLTYILGALYRNTSGVTQNIIFTTHKP